MVPIAVLVVYEGANRLPEDFKHDLGDRLMFQSKDGIKFTRESEERPCVRMGETKLLGRM
jgi:hypothetical protein